jgi:hypothetical protein
MIVVIVVVAVVNVAGFVVLDVVLASMEYREARGG